MPHDAINEGSITGGVMGVAIACAEADLELVVGGWVSTEAISALREVQLIRLDRFETRKVIFTGEAIQSPSIRAGIRNAVEFELAWLKNKREYYGTIAAEDEKRIGMMEARLAKTEPALYARVA